MLHKLVHFRCIQQFTSNSVFASQRVGNSFFYKKNMEVEGWKTLPNCIHTIGVLNTMDRGKNNGYKGLGTLHNMQVSHMVGKHKSTKVPGAIMEGLISTWSASSHNHYADYNAKQRSNPPNYRYQHEPRTPQEDKQQSFEFRNFHTSQLQMIALD